MVTLKNTFCIFFSFFSQMSEKEKIPEKTAYHLASVMLCHRFWRQVKCAGGEKHVLSGTQDSGE